MLAGDEHHDIVRGIGELRPIGLVAERVDVRLDRRGVSSEVEPARALIDRAERVLVGVQGDLGVDDQGLPAGNANDDVGTLAGPLVVGMADLGGEVGMFGKAAAFEHVAQLLLTPAAARLGSVAQRVDQFRRFGRDPLGAGSHCIDLTSKQSERVLALALNLAHRLLIFLQPFVNWLQQGFQIVAGRRFAFLEALVGAFEELLLRAFEQLSADLGELRTKRFLRGGDFGEPDFERPLALFLRRTRRGVTRGKLMMLAAQHVDRSGMGIALLAHAVELKPQRFRHPLPRRAPPRPKQPAEHRPQSKRGYDKDNRGRVQAALLKWNEMRT
jgi:hypothetical protein